ncbi:hypothetical protein [Friedmanniella luteola]|uniref:hypothetical protein n=1 Tax=Friedmanniella luteola TaxID=546871 RepID=UPI00155F9A16|nr:hypothetical protein [Friedmanniella luteola]
MTAAAAGSTALPAAAPEEIGPDGCPESMRACLTASGFEMKSVEGGSSVVTRDEDTQRSLGPGTGASGEAELVDARQIDPPAAGDGRGGLLVVGGTVLRRVGRSCRGDPGRGSSAVRQDQEGDGPSRSTAR